MQIYRNDQFIQRRAKLGRYANLGGMGILLFGLIVNLTRQTEGLMLSMLALIVGFVLYQVGMYFTLRYEDDPRRITADEPLRNARDARAAGRARAAGTVPAAAGAFADGRLKKNRHPGGSFGTRRAGVPQDDKVTGLACPWPGS